VSTGNKLASAEAVCSKAQRPVETHLQATRRGPLVFPGQGASRPRGAIKNRYLSSKASCFLGVCTTTAVNPSRGPMRDLEHSVVQRLLATFCCFFLNWERLTGGGIVWGCPQENCTCVVQYATVGGGR